MARSGRNGIAALTQWNSRARSLLLFIKINCGRVSHFLLVTARPLASLARLPTLWAGPCACVGTNLFSLHSRATLTRAARPACTDF